MLHKDNTIATLKTKNDILLGILEDFIEQFSEVMVTNPIGDILENAKDNNVHESNKTFMLF